MRAESLDNRARSVDNVCVIMAKRPLQNVNVVFGDSVHSRGTTVRTRKDGRSSRARCNRSMKSVSRPTRRAVQGRAIWEKVQPDVGRVSVNLRYRIQDASCFLRCTLQHRADQLRN